MTEVRCPNCTHLLFKAQSWAGGQIEVKCPSCKTVVLWPVLMAQPGTFPSGVGPSETAQRPPPEPREPPGGTSITGPPPAPGPPRWFGPK